MASLTRREFIDKAGTLTGVVLALPLLAACGLTPRPLLTMLPDGPSC